MTIPLIELSNRMSDGKETLLKSDRVSEYGSVTNNNGLDDTTRDTTRVNTQDLNDVYRDIGVRLSQYLYWTATALISYSDYAELTILSVALPFLQCEWELSPLFETAIAMSVFVSYAVFALLFGRISDIHGRKVVLVCSGLVLITSAVVSAVAPNEWVFLASRIVTGACVGINLSAICCYATETAESRYRMIGVSTFIISNMIGYLVVNALALALIQIVGWRWFIIIASAPILPAVALIIFLPESPRYLCVSGKQDKAHEALRTMARLNGATLPTDLNVVCMVEERDLGSYSVVFSKKFRNSTICLAVIYFMDIFIEFGFIIFLPLYFSSGFCVATEGQRKAKNCTALNTDDLINLTITSVVALIGILLSLALSHKIGRLWPIRVLSILQTVGMALLFVCFSQNFSTVVLNLTKAVQSFINASIWIMLPESFTTDVRSTAVGFVNGAGKFGGVLGTGAVQFFFAMDPNIVIGLFLASSVIGAAATFFLDRETKQAQLI